MQVNQKFVRGQSGLLTPDTTIRVGGKFAGTIVRQGEVIDEFECPNLVTTEGLNSLLNIMFNGAAQIGTWYTGIFEGNYTPVAGVTAATVAAAATECVAYTGATRPEYVEVASTVASVTNAASRASFVFNATKTIYGAFMGSSSVKNGASGTLFSIARFATAKSVDTGDELLLTYTLGAASV